MGKGKSYGNSTTHMQKLLPRIEGGGGGGCPILVFGISSKLYLEDIAPSTVLQADAMIDGGDDEQSE